MGLVTNNLKIGWMKLCSLFRRIPVYGIILLTESLGKNQYAYNQSVNDTLFITFIFF